MSRNCNCHGSGDKPSETVAALLERPRYSPGLILEDSDLTAAVEYTRSLNRLLFRNLFGCGVICGLTVEVKKECGVEVTVAKGLALDGCGDPIELPRDLKITLDKRDGVIGDTAEAKPPKTEFWIVLCGGEKQCAPRQLVCDSDEFDAAAQNTRIRSLAQVSITFEKPECVCGCGPADARGQVDCHRDQKERVECAPDCGCGTACDCGCCVLLAHVQWADASPWWKVTHQNVRRFVRPALIEDPADKIRDAKPLGKSRSADPVLDRASARVREVFARTRAEARQPTEAEVVELVAEQIRLVREQPAAAAGSSASRAAKVAGANVKAARAGKASGAKPGGQEAAPTKPATASGAATGAGAGQDKPAEGGAEAGSGKSPS